MRFLPLLLLTACVSSTAVQSPLLPLRVHVDPQFRFVGEQRFILRGNADVTQHLFLDDTSSRLIWIQYERYLPAATGEYNYERAKVVRIGRLEFDVHVRQYVAPPDDPESDRARVWQLLEAKGRHFEVPATRVRLVHVPRNDPRSELMIIYAERGAIADEAALLERATAAFAIGR